MENEKKLVPVDKALYKFEDGRVYIESEELANALRNYEFELFIDEEANALSNNIVCGISCV